MQQDAVGFLDQALAAAARGPFFPDPEFGTLFGMSRAEVAALVGTLSQVPPTRTQITGVGNAVNNLLGYPHGHDAQWSRWLTCTPDELESAFKAWKASIGGA
jgi:hypothetical protein